MSRQLSLANEPDTGSHRTSDVAVRSVSQGPGTNSSVVCPLQFGHFTSTASGLAGASTEREEKEKIETKLLGAGSCRSGRDQEHNDQETFDSAYLVSVTVEITQQPLCLIAFASFLWGVPVPVCEKLESIKDLLMPCR